MTQYRNDYPNKPIGGSNPYYCCYYCERPDPEINGIVENHSKWCEWRIDVEREKDVENLLKKLKEAKVLLEESDLDKEMESDAKEKILQLLEESVVIASKWEE